MKYIGFQVGDRVKFVFSTYGSEGLRVGDGGVITKVLEGGVHVLPDRGPFSVTGAHHSPMLFLDDQVVVVQRMPSWWPMLRNALKVIIFCVVLSAALVVAARGLLKIHPIFPGVFW